jgi:hypothetical protein
VIVYRVESITMARSPATLAEKPRSTNPPQFRRGAVRSLNDPPNGEFRFASSR